MRLYISSLLLLCSPLATLTGQNANADGHNIGAVEHVSPYGFCFSLPNDWGGFSIVQKPWEGYRSCVKGSCPVTQGPQILIRNPKWSAGKPYEDIPIMVFTSRQWLSVRQGTFLVSAAPFPPSELGHNG